MAHLIPFNTLMIATFKIYFKGNLLGTSSHDIIFFQPRWILRFRVPSSTAQTLVLLHSYRQRNALFESLSIKERLDCWCFWQN